MAMVWDLELMAVEKYCLPELGGGWIFATLSDDLSEMYLDLPHCHGSVSGGRS
jgi:hypothetical protein